MWDGKTHLGEGEEECSRPAQLLRPLKIMRLKEEQRDRKARLKNTTLCTLTLRPRQRHLADIQLFGRGDFWLHQAGGSLDVLEDVGRAVLA